MVVVFVFVVIKVTSNAEPLQYRQHEKGRGSRMRMEKGRKGGKCEGSKREEMKRSELGRDEREGRK